MTRNPKPTIDGSALLDRLRETIRCYVILPSTEALDAVTLWVAATHAITAWACAPRLVIRAPEKRCGKSRLLDLAEAASHNPLMTVNTSPAAIIRSISNDNPPTLLIDEYDTIFTKAGDNEDLRGLINAGFQRNRPARRYDPNTRQVENLETFAMVGMAGIGAAPDTIEDRAVVIHMRRRAKDREKVQPWRIMRDRPKVEAIGNELNAWLAPHLDQLRDTVPVMPVEDRDADTWEPLIAIADLAGGEWPIRARTAAVALTGAREETAMTSDRIRLLADCRTIFTTAGHQAETLPTTHIIEQLKAMDESPWLDLSPHKLGGLLRDFGIKSDTIRFPTGQAKGYRRADFADAWDRYCDVESSTLAEEAYQPYQASQPSSETVRMRSRYGSKRTAQDSVPGLTSDATVGTDGTETPRDAGNASTPTHGHLRLVDGAQ
ncbi:MAG TPA: DUF3631 domain-containing protein [Candidatus Limnocylindrales bacterium]|nr:DUF3631 domain-containing protein [Candidatus Limnocylindrales bacterium]